MPNIRFYLWYGFNYLDSPRLPCNRKEHRDAKKAKDVVRENQNGQADINGYKMNSYTNSIFKLIQIILYNADVAAVSSIYWTIKDAQSVYSPFGDYKLSGFGR
ncbi:MAG: hypothetical protein ABJA79_01800 [Parafilimonas sp.]